MSDDEMVVKAQGLLRSAPAFSSDMDRARILVHGMGPYIIAEHLRTMAKRYAGQFPAVARDMREEAERLDRRGRMVEPA